MGKQLALAVFCCFCLLFPKCAFAQTHSSGRLAGTVLDEQGTAISGAEITATNVANGERRSATSDESGSYVIESLARGIYKVRVTAGDRASTAYNNIRIRSGKTTTLNPLLGVAPFGATVYDSPPVLQAESPQLSTTMDAKVLAAMPLPTRNFLQLTTLAPGVSTALTNNSAIGRNSPNINVNGARNSQNNLQINGVDANEIASHDFTGVAVPAPESIGELVVQTSMPDITVGGGGAVVQISTRNGTNKYHGDVYEYFRNDALNANDPNLKAAGERRPVLRRNVYGATLGGPLRKDHAFFFISYQGTREANGATDQSLYKNVLIARGLTNDRSEAGLLNTFHPVLADGTPASSIDPVALKLLNARLPNGQFLIPTPQANGRVTGSVLSTYREEQFNTNFDFRLGRKDTLSPKFFFANAPQLDGLGSVGLPGFGAKIDNDNRVLAIREVHSFSSRTINEARVGYNFIRERELTGEPFKDSDFGITRSTAGVYPGLPSITLGREDGTGSIGTQPVTLQTTSSSFSAFDVLSLDRRNHHLRFGGEFHSYEWKGSAIVGSYGIIDFARFNDFLVGNSDFSALGIGIVQRDFRSTDYAAFVQDDWKLSPKLVINLGLRYELDLPPYETHGQIGGFDPALYRPSKQVDSNGFPVGPPAAGYFEADNVLPQFNLPGVQKVGKRMLKSVGPLNFGPRIGFAWSPSNSGLSVVRGGYGIFYSRPSFFYLGLDSITPPFYTLATFSGATFANPFPGAPPESAFPGIPAGIPFSPVEQLLDRNNRTPYVEQFNASLQYELWRDTSLQVAYVGTHGLRLFRTVFINQANIASTLHPIRNAVTGQVITTNTFDNAPLRAPMQGVDIASFALNQSNGASTYHSLQVTLQRRLSNRLQFQAAYTYSKSIDNGSNSGGGAATDGTIDTSTGGDTSNVFGNQLAGRSNLGLSDFDRTHRFVGYFVWTPAKPAFARSSAARHLLSNWELSGIITLMSGLPIDIFDPGGGSFYGLNGARPNWAPGANRRTALTNIPPGYYFNPFAFALATVQPGQAIPSAHDPTALAGDVGTDIGNVGRNVLRGPAQSNVDFSILRRFPIREEKTVELRADFFNVLNHANRDNPISNIGTVTATGGSIDPTTGQILSPGDFGRIVGYSSSPRIVQLALSFKF